MPNNPSLVAPPLGAVMTLTTIAVVSGTRLVDFASFAKLKVPYHCITLYLIASLFDAATSDILSNAPTQQK